MSEKQRILDMIEQGKVSAAEGLELLNAIEATDPAPVKAKGKYTMLKVLVDIEENEVKVDVNVPLQLLRVLGNAAVNLNKVIPENAQNEIQEKGIDVSAIDFNAIIDAVEEGTLLDPNIINVNINDKESGLVMVKVYVD